MNEIDIAKMMRGSLWEESKGKLKAMLHTFYAANSRDGQFEKFDKQLEEFIKQVELYGLHE